jgi:capsular polysaccharide biosynthesis protein
MSNSSNSKLFSLKNFLTIITLSILIGVASFSFSFWQTPKYKSTVKLLTVFNQNNIDTYTASKTANYITGILAEVIYSDSFINSIYNGNAELIDDLGYGSEKRQKNWNEKVKTKTLENKGILIIDAFGNDKNQTRLLATAIGETIASQHGLYDGSADRVTIKIIDTPSILESWSTTKIARDTAIGFLAGLILAFTFIVIFPNHQLFEFNSKKKYYQNLYTTPGRQTETAMNQAPEINSQTSAYYQNEATRKTDNPWLEKYYEENNQ